MNTVYIICGIIFLVVIFIYCQNAGDVNNLTKEQIIALYQKHSGKKINSPDDFCVEKAESFKGIYSVGWFAHDRGCSGNEILVGKQIGEVLKMTPNALKLNGWENKTKQQELALKWTKEVLLVWQIPLNESNEDFGRDTTPTFETPTCVEDNDQWVVKIWVQRPAGMQPQSEYYQLKTIFDRNGNIVDQNKINSFVVKYN